ncbi:hypothetical protein M9H77_25144 [Catharanthus roseus]|uniref:Uncharacterized protein n=1 Tax=Catharanthus roseus TaxID=4058 RepID=A0ACC0A6G4_CATRO|nr:hypothetical protein M9H77_25144 [Catharanthus roseus]
MTDVLSINDTDADGNIVCYAPTMITTNGIWQGDNPLDYSLPLFILQLTMIVVVTRILVYLLKPFRQPRVISEVLGGVILGPSVLGQIKSFSTELFPLRSVMILETMANIGLLYFLFLVGVEMDLSVIRRTGKKALIIALAGMVLPFLIGALFSFMLDETKGEKHNGTFVLFLGVALSVTAFPVLARILAELKLLNTEMGRLALSSALINDMCAWILLVVAIAMAENDSTTLASFWVILSSIGFVLFCLFIIRPLISWVIRRTPEGESISDFNLCLILTGVMISGFITDSIGTHSVFGAFVYGLVIPNGSLGITLIERLEDFVSGLLLPLFFAISGLKTEIQAIEGPRTWGVVFVITVLACAGKVAGTLLVALYYKMPIFEGLTLGLLMNTKGLVEMIILNVGKDQKILDNRAFAIMIIVALIMTSIIIPSVTIIYKPARKFVAYKRRTVQRSKRDGEFRVLVCIHTPRNVPTIINLIEASHPCKKSPICIYVLHLVELTGRASAMLIVHNTRKSSRPAMNRTQAQCDHIIHAFENFEQHHSGSHVTVQPLTAISPYSTMHEDICRLAEDKRAAIIIIPFHKQQTVDGGMEATNPAFRTINQNLLANAPCSVGILVDRGLSGSTRLVGGHVSHHVAVLFFGGPDDREALAYGWRMSEHPGINLTVMRFLSIEESFKSVSGSRHSQSHRHSHSSSSSSSSGISTKDHHQQEQEQEQEAGGGGGGGGGGILTIVTENDRDKQLDEDYLDEFKSRTCNNESIVFIEEVVNNGEETVASIRAIDNVHDLFIVGRGQGTISSLTAGLTDWSECPELGAIGDLLASSDFAATVSVLVVQQYVGMEVHGGYICSTPESPTHDHQQHDHPFPTVPVPGPGPMNRRTPPPRGEQPLFHSQP